MVRWIVNILFSGICIYALVDFFTLKDKALVILMTPYILFQLLQVVLLLTNKRPIQGANSLKEVVIPVLGAGWPIIISIILKPTFVVGYPNLIVIGSVLLILLYTLELISLITLRYSFSILPEARKIVKKGPYSYVRHPLYSLYIVWAILNAILTMDILYFFFGLFPLMIFLTFRAKMEEKKLSQNFEEYNQYMQETGMFFPRLKRGEGSALNTRI